MDGIRKKNFKKREENSRENILDPGIWEFFSFFLLFERKAKVEEKSRAKRQKLPSKLRAHLDSQNLKSVAVFFSLAQQSFFLCFSFSPVAWLAYSSLATRDSRLATSRYFIIFSHHSSDKDPDSQDSS
jgi:hypothetical protein